MPSALDAARQALTVYPSYVRGWMTLAQVAKAAGDDKLALNSYEKVTELYYTPVRQYAALEVLSDPGFAEAWHAVGLLALAEGRIDEASFALGLAAEELEVYLRHARRRRQIMAATGEWNEAQYRRLRAMATEVAERLVGLGQPSGLRRAAKLYRALGDRDTARHIISLIKEGVDR